MKIVIDWHDKEDKAQITCLTDDGQVIDQSDVMSGHEAIARSLVVMAFIAEMERKYGESPSQPLSA